MSESRDDLAGWEEAQELFDDVVDLEPRLRAERLKQLEPEVRERLLQMLAADEASSFLDHGAEQLAQSLEAEEGDSGRPGTLVGRRFGPYRLEEEIGRGGMSVVYRARRDDANYEQEVALKILATAEVALGGTERFRQEVQFLAQLTHPGIATLLDAGVADDGTPWLAMELVEGVRIDDYCEREGLSAREIARLMLDVVDAVSFAHGRLIVHRDLKPGNVLVDSNGRPRLLDFGIGKLVADDAAELERTSTRVLTPEYGSPEQWRGESVTTATDVHGLGSLLYRLLSGQPPYGGGGAMERTAAPPLRQAEGVVEGVDRDLELITQVALHENPSRRYPSAAALGEDLRRWIELRPVQAAPDAWSYRLRKLIERRRGASIATMALLAAIVLGVFGTVWQARRARGEAERSAREARRANEVSDFLTSLFEFASPDVSGGRDLRVAEALEMGSRRIDAELASVPTVRADLLVTIAGIYRSLGLYDEARAALERLEEDSESLSAALDVRANLAAARVAVDLAEPEETFLEQLTPKIEDRSLPIELRGEVATFVGDRLRRATRFDEAETTLQRALELAVERTDEDAVLAVADVHGRLAAVAYDRGQHERAEALYDEALEDLRSELSTDHTMIANVLFAQGILFSEMRRDDEAIAAFQESIAMRRRLLGPSHPDVAIGLVDLAAAFNASGRYEEAGEAHEEAFAILSERLGAEHPEVLELQNSMAVRLYQTGDAEAAVELLSDTVEKMTRVLGPEDPVRLEVAVNLAAMMRVLQRYDEALPLLLEALERQLSIYGEEHATTAHTLSHIGSLHRARGEFDAALDYYRRANAATRAAVGAEHPETLIGQANLAGLLFELGRFDESAEIFAEAHDRMLETMEPGDPLVVAIGARRARAMTAVGESAEALELARASVERNLELFGDEHTRTWEAELAEAEALRTLGRSGEARDEIVDLLERVERVRPDWRHREELREWLAAIR